ncbi:MAG: OB-fold nucleic acid binding domain-containing protein, partial [Planctomycetota bacterium]
MADATETPELSASEYEQERRKKRQTLVDAGLDIYGRRTTGITPVADAPQPPQEGEGDVVKVAGRVVLKRDMGKLSFLTIRDATGDLQIGLQKNRLDDNGWLVRQNLDLGDQIVAEGPIGLTKTGQPTVWATSVSMASKSLVVPPDKHKGLADPELRYRQRYVDLWANPESMEVMQKR